MEGVTRESLRPLLDLQRVDTRIDQLNQRKADLPEQRAFDEFVERRTEVGGAHAEKQAELDAVAREQSRIEDDVQAIERKISHEQERLYGGDISNPKELANIQAELDALRRRKSHLEDQELDVMERREGLEAETGELGKTLTELDARITEATARRDTSATEIERELIELSAQRETLVPGIPGEALELYQSMRARMGGVAVGALRDGMCTACGLPLSPLARDQIRHSDNPIVRCENCRRILVVA